MDTEGITKLFNNIPEGAHFKSDVDFNATYIKPKQDEQCHLDTMVISLVTGDVIHFSKVIKSQVHWGLIGHDGFPYYENLETVKEYRQKK